MKQLYMDPGVFLLSFLLSAFGSAVIYKFGLKISLIDHPNLRSSHTFPIPRGGGIGIWLVFVFIGFFIIKEYSFTLIGALIGLLGFLEDRFSLPSIFRLCVQLLLSLVAVGLFFGLPDSINKIFLFLFLVMFITATTNIYNFMDGINGIAAVTGIIGFILFAIFLALYNMPYNKYLFSVSLMFSCLGFLPFNMPKAKVFMGDTGSILLGFIFSSMIISFSKSFSDFMCLSSFLFPFYSDELTTMYIRIRNKENLLSPHRQHLYQLLANEFKIPHWKISIIYGVIQFFVGFSILLLKPFGTAILCPLIIYFLIFCFISFHFRRILNERRKL